MTWEKISRIFRLVYLQFEKVTHELGARPILVLSTALFIIFVSVLLIDNWIESFNTQSLKILESRLVVNNLNQLKFNLTSAESAQRGYLTTGNKNYIEKFNQSVHAARSNISYINNFYIRDINPNVKEHAWLKNVNASLEAKISEMKIIISMLQAGNTKGAVEVSKLESQIGEMDKFNLYSNFLLKYRYADVNKRFTDRRNSTNIARISILLSSLVWTFLVILVIKQLIKAIALKSNLQISLFKEKGYCEDRLKEQQLLVRNLALDYQADVERERQRLSRELHDELGSIFTATKMDISWVIKKLKEPADSISTKPLIEKLWRTNEYITRGINFHRQVIEELYPSMITKFGIWQALVSLIAEATERNGWQLKLILPDENTKLNETIALIVYRVVQETINNAQKYSQAISLSVSIISDEKFLKIEIEDDGIGVDLSTLEGRTHGLIGMQKRVQAIGGHYEVMSKPNKGVLTRAIIPLDTSV